MSEKRCTLCNKSYDYEYELFGRGCIDNLYEMLKVQKPPRFIKNKEMYLCNRISARNFKFFLNKNKKYALTQKYIALSYLNKMNYDFLDNVKNKITRDIKLISLFSRIVETFPFKLNDVYQLFNYSQKFDETIENLKNINWEEIDKKVAKDTINSLSFIFDISKKNSPIFYTGFYSMQYMFWQVIVIGGLLVDKKLSSKLLSHSLTPPEEKPNDLIIEDEETRQLIEEDDIFKDKIKLLKEKYGNETGEFILNDENNEDTKISFENNDLLYALHNALIFVNAKRNNDDTWNLEIEISDTYDFTEFKDLKKYTDSENWLTDMISTTLNNLGVVSYEYGVIKKFDVKIKFKLYNYPI